MSQPDDFDALYKDVRDRLLVEAYALTGDRDVSRSAVRDAMTVAWHHWHTVQRLDDKMGWLRPHVWRRARNRHTARPWHKERDLPESAAATLEALDHLSLNERKALVLTYLSPVPLGEMAREIGLPLAATQTLCVSAVETFTQKRECTPGGIGPLLEELRPVTAGSRWPRSTIVRRAGTTRRRSYALAGIFATVALVFSSGTLVAQGTEAEAALSEQGFDRRPLKVDTAPALPELSESALLAESQVQRVDRSLDWSAGETHDNTSGDGLVLPCQQTSFADPDGLGAYVRTFEGTPRKGKDRKAVATAVEMVELSRTEEDAQRAYDTALGWFTACNAARTQLLRVNKVASLGDEAALVTLRTWGGSTRTIQVGLARTGQVITTTVSEVQGLRRGTAPVATMLGAAVNGLCGTPGSGSCASATTPKPVAVPVAGQVPGMLSEVDLPPVAGARGRWGGTTPAKDSQSRAATHCDKTKFSSKSFTDNLSRTFVFPDVKKERVFGVTETVGTARSARQAKAFVQQVRKELGDCADPPAGPKVARLLNQRGKKSEITAWYVDVPLDDDRSLEYLMAIVRHGNTVAQVGVTTDGRLDMKRSDFLALSRRAKERLPHLKLEGRG
ncbi:RNA polymerase sigma factor [Nocardioides gilvus]|uniref:RNA polymerase sigma factor n=1 Tax=Nocardioides gilvus TaxID=1735589 RepID=UPI0013A5B55E|nr:sigma-70 family RNA polymerase sigma factor [Nocardioides gilvus]